MPMHIQSTQVGPIEEWNATVQIVLADNAEVDKAVEILQVRTRIDVASDAYLPKLQVAALTRAVQLIEESIAQIRASWKAR